MAKNELLTDAQFNAPENQNRDSAIIGYRSLAPNPFPPACAHDFVYKILYDHTAGDVCTKCGYFQKQAPPTGA